MKFTHYRVGHVAGGTVVEVRLQGSAANVRLMDQSNFNNYKAGRRHRYAGGLARRSPVRLEVPHSGTWHVTVDMQGLRGTVRSGVRVIAVEGEEPSAISREVEVGDVPSVEECATSVQVSKIESPENRGFDVFISHASEDKDEVARPLARALRETGLKVLFPRLFRTKLRILGDGRVPDSSI